MCIPDLCMADIRLPSPSVWNMSDHIVPPPDWVLTSSNPSYTIPSQPHSMGRLFPDSRDGMASSACPVEECDDVFDSKHGARIHFRYHTEDEKRSTLISVINQLNDDLGRPPTPDEMDDCGVFSVTTYQHYMGRGQMLFARQAMNHNVTVASRKKTCWPRSTLYTRNLDTCQQHQILFASANIVSGRLPRDSGVGIGRLPRLVTSLMSCVKLI
jgi:hypothetical protein